VEKTLAERDAELQQVKEELDSVKGNAANLPPLQDKVKSLELQVTSVSIAVF
jgi:Tfp pilus assembly protein PilO